MRPASQSHLEAVPNKVKRSTLGEALFRERDEDGAGQACTNTPLKLVHRNLSPVFERVGESSSQALSAVRTYGGKKVLVMRWHGYRTTRESLLAQCDKI